MPIGFMKLLYYCMRQLRQDEKAVTVDYYDLDRLIYRYGNYEYTIRMFNIDRHGVTTYTVFKKTFEVKLDGKDYGIVYNKVPVVSGVVDINKVVI